MYEERAGFARNVENLKIRAILWRSFFREEREKEMDRELQNSRIYALVHLEKERNRNLK